MLTLGLMEGVLSATLGLLVLVGAANENAPLHKIFGPMVAAVVGVAAYGVHAAGAMHEAANVLGLGVFAFLAFFAPLGVMRYAWKQTRAMDATSAHGRPAAQARVALTAAAPEPAPREEAPARRVA